MKTYITDLALQVEIEYTLSPPPSPQLSSPIREDEPPTLEIHAIHILHLGKRTGETLDLPSQTLERLTAAIYDDVWSDQ